MTPAQKILADLKVILREAEKAGTEAVLPNVPVYFTAAEMRAVVAALETVTD